MALRLQEVMPTVDFQYICTPTGNEFPEVFEHIRQMEQLLGKPILKLQPLAPGDGLVNVILRERMIPNFRARFCTRMLKIDPTISWLKENAPVTHYVGLRADEGEREGIYGDIEGVQHRYPFREWGWGIDEVWSYLDARNVNVPIRTDCAWCFYQRLVEWWWLWKKYPEVYEAGVKLEESIGHTFRSPGRDTWPTSLKDLRQRFEAGHRPRGAQDRLQNTFAFSNCDMDEMCRVCTL